VTCKIVAELSCNHAGLLSNALKLVEAAAAAGADSIKLQTWTPGSMVVDPHYVLRDGPWVGRRLAELYEQAQTPLEWHGQLFNHAKGLGLEAFSTVFDLPALDFLESIGCPAYKIASFELIDLRLIRNVAATKKPLIISTGMGIRQEIDDAVREARGAGASDLTLLKCTSAYPAAPSQANLSTIWHMRQTFGCAVGLSDHTKGIGVAIAAAGLGASMIEKHLVLENAVTLDREFSLTPNEFAWMVKGCREAEQSFGEPIYGPHELEKPQLALRRSIYFAKDLEAGALITRDAITTARPANGLAPRYFDRLVGRRLTQDVKRGMPASWDLVEIKTLEAQLSHG
jgi:N-acetylneuraminate synthase